ncbi:hypothetical protein [Microlunatus parietis]|uniref:Uncharacterized protein n=1 Tax=Microlunatus parietis TaxID=682979 RepID=A0A7Y9I2J0_9ACTN|nr:hypothetical protein [Microlunatus parietis]NYE68875.1 hypothetical protein [Microlunatus parietis]
MSASKPIATFGVTRDAADPKAGLTLDELGAFVQACHRLGHPGDTPIRITIGWASQIKSIRSHPRPVTTVEADHDG